MLVAEYDNQAVPKIIDFGVAKALNTRLTDKTIYTEHLQIIGTLLYMSPEQAELSGLDIDTRSDIYSLARPVSSYEHWQGILALCSWANTTRERISVRHFLRRAVTAVQTRQVAPDLLRIAPANTRLGVQEEK